MADDVQALIEQFTPQQAREFLRLRTFAPMWWTIESKSAGYVPFQLTRAQRLTDDEYERQMDERGFVRINVLKCRQVGNTTYWTRKALLYVMHREASTALTIAHEKTLPGEWLRKCRRNIEQTPECLRPKQQTEQGHQLSFENGSRYYIGSAQGGFPGMGDTIHFSHKSECGRWDKPPISKNPDDVLIPLTPAIPTGDDRIGTVDVYESTGVMQGDWWHRKWMSGKEDEDEFVNLFLPWFLVETYKRDDLASDVLDLSPYERFMVSEALKYDVELSHAQIAWYRNALRQPPYHGNADEFKAEYPSTEDEAFMSPGASIYTPEEVRNARLTQREPEWRGNLLGMDAAPSQAQQVPNSESGEFFVLEWPDERYHYVVGADCMWGRGKDNDWDYLHVECLETGKVVAWLKTQCTMPEWAWKIAAVGFLYNTAVVAPERNAQAGAAADGVINTLLGLVNSWRYPNLWVRSQDAKLKGYKPEDYGWYTDHLSKGQLIAFSQEQTSLGAFDWADREAIDQMATIIRHEDNSIGAPEGSHDDAWMSRLITAQVAHRVRQRTELYVEPSPVGPFQMTTPQARLAHMLRGDDDE